MAYTTINDPTQYFHTQLYTGDGTTGRSITNDANAGNFQPDWLWIKERSSTSSHRLTDSSRGVNKVLITSGTNEELTRDEIGSYDTDGFTIDGTVDTVLSVNENSVTYVAWQWKANGGTTSSNTDGSITSTVQANTTAGFSIVTYTGTGSAGSVGHNLGKTPKMLIVKNRTDAGSDWFVYHSGNTSAPETDALKLNTNEATNDFASFWNDTAPTSSVFTVGTSNGTNGSGDNYVAYCFAEIEGYSSFGKYTGNGSTDGTFVYTGFKPAFILTKRTDTVGQWYLKDTKRSSSGGFNTVGTYLKPNSSDAEGTNDGAEATDILSNGFKQRNTEGNMNASGGTYIYMAFAESPFVSSDGVPTTAR